MTALPSNLAFVGEDLARAISRDARRSAQAPPQSDTRDRVAVLVVTATAASPTAGCSTRRRRCARCRLSVAAPGAERVRGARRHIGRRGSSRSPRQSIAPANPGHGQHTFPRHGQRGPDANLLSDLGPQQRVLTSVATTAGGVCLLLTGFDVECVPTFEADSNISWFAGDADSGAARDLRIRPRRRDGRSRPFRRRADARSLASPNNAFYLEFTDGEPGSLVAHLT